MGSVEGLNAHMPQIRREKFKVAFTLDGEQPTLISSSYSILIWELRLLMGLVFGCKELEDNTNITTNRATIRKKTKVGLQFHFYDYYNHTLLPVFERKGSCVVTKCSQYLQTG